MAAAYDPMKIIAISLLLLFSDLFVGIHGSRSGPAPSGSDKDSDKSEQLIESTCYKTSVPFVCMTTLQGSDKVSRHPPRTIRELLKRSLLTSAMEAEKLSAIVGGLLRNQNLNQSGRDSLEFCHKGYSSEVVYSLRTAANDDLKGEVEYSVVEDRLKSVEAFIVRCEEGCVKKWGSVSPLNAHNEYQMKLAHLNLDLLHLLMKKADLDVTLADDKSM